MGISQLKRLEKFIKFRRNISKIYKKFFLKIPHLVNLPIFSDKNLPSWHLFVISVNFKNMLCNKSDFIKFFQKKKIITQFHYIPIYRFKVFNKKIKKYQMSGAESYYCNSVSLPIYYGLSNKKINYIIKNLRYFFKNYSK